VRADQERWNDRYRAALTGPPREVLVAVSALLPATGRALDLACGTGAEAVWLAGRGLVVDAVDVAEAGLAAARLAIGAAGVDQRVRLVHADLDQGVPAVCDGPYQLICALHFRAPVVEQAIVGLLAPDGTVLATRLSMVGRHVGDQHRPAPAFLARPGELLALASRCDLEVLEHREGEGEAMLVARRRAVPSPSGPVECRD
jgi:SAM-dependent methyltransferase